MKKILFGKIPFPNRLRKTLNTWIKRPLFQWSFSNYTQLYYFFSHLSLVMKQKKNLADAKVFPGRIALFPFTFLFPLLS